MKRIKVPSLQHLARQWRPNAEGIQRALVHVAKHPPTFSYTPVNDAIRDMFVFGVELNEVMRGIREKVKRDFVRNNFLEILPLAARYVDRLAPDFVLDVAPQYYSISRDLMVPFKPPMLCGVKGVLVMPWFTYWKNNPLDKLQTALFVTIVREMLAQNPDLEHAELRLVGFSAPEPGLPRVLHVRDASRIASLPADKVKAMLDVFARGYALALQEMSQAQEDEQHENQKDSDVQARLPLSRR